MYRDSASARGAKVAGSLKISNTCPSTCPSYPDRPPPPPPVYNERRVHRTFLFGPYFSRTSLIRFLIRDWASELRFQAKGLGKSGVVVMYFAVMVGKFVKQVVREWCPSTTGSATGLDLTAVSKGCWRGRTQCGQKKHRGAEPKSGIDDSDRDTDGHCDVIWARAGRGVWGFCHVFENTLYLNRDLMEDSAVPSNLSVLKVPERIGLPLLLVPSGAPSLGGMFNFSS